MRKDVLHKKGYDYLTRSFKASGGLAAVSLGSLQGRRKRLHKVYRPCSDHEWYELHDEKWEAMGIKTPRWRLCARCLQKQEYQYWWRQVDEPLKGRWKWMLEEGDKAVTAAGESAPLRRADHTRIGPGCDFDYRRN